MLHIGTDSRLSKLPKIYRARAAKQKLTTQAALDNEKAMGKRRVTLAAHAKEDSSLRHTNAANVSKAS